VVGCSLLFFFDLICYFLLSFFKKRERKGKEKKRKRKEKEKKKEKKKNTFSFVISWIVE